jgi:hypothetical protein
VTVRTFRILKTARGQNAYQSHLSADARWDKFAKVISVSVIAAMASSAIVLPVLAVVAAVVFAG